MTSNQPKNREELVEAVDKMTALACRVYDRPDERAAMRCALGDAAAVCDHIALTIKNEHTKRGRLTKQGVVLHDLAKRCGDEIFAMREKISVRDAPPLAASPFRE